MTRTLAIGLGLLGACQGGGEGSSESAGTTTGGETTTTTTTTTGVTTTSTASTSEATSTSTSSSTTEGSTVGTTAVSVSEASGPETTGTTSDGTTTTEGTTTEGTTSEGTTTEGTTTDGTTTDDATTGDDTTTGDPPELGPFDVIDLEAGHGHACAVLASGRVKCWGGYTEHGDLGLGNKDTYGLTPGTMGNNLPFVDLGAGVLATQVSSYYQGCAVIDGDALKCWGQSTFGALGSGAGEDLGDQPGEMGDALPTVALGAGRTVVHLATAVWTTCVVLDDASAKCWGWNSNGWLGQGDKNHRGDQPGEMGDMLPAIDLGGGAQVVTIAIDNSHACALLKDATVKCWGQRAEGNLGLGAPGGPIGDGPGEMGDALPIIDFGAGLTVKALAVGARHACVILNNDKVKCWGSNTFGQLGLGDTAHRGDDPGEMGDALPFVDLGEGRTAVQIAASYFHSCAVLDDDSLKCWGRNVGGALGLGDTDNRGDGPGEMGDMLPPIDLGKGLRAIKVAPGANYICALLDNHGVKCWGIGGIQSALGYEDMEARGDQPGEMGDALPFVDLGSE